MSIFKALLEVQSKVGAIPKNRQGHGYKYADLDAIWDAIRPVLAKAGVSIWQGVEDHEGRAAVRTIICHAESGDKLESLAVEPPVTAANSRMSPVQQMGSSVTYLRRYALVAALGLTTDEDTDGAWIEETKREDKAERERALVEATENAVKRCAAFVDKSEFTKLKAELLERWGQGGKLPKPMLEAIAEQFVQFEKRQKEQANG